MILLPVHLAFKILNGLNTYMRMLLIGVQDILASKLT